MQGQVACSDKRIVKKLIFGAKIMRICATCECWKWQKINVTQFYVLFSFYFIMIRFCYHLPISIHTNMSVRFPPPSYI